MTTPNSDFVTVVSGLPRSGTSMMMRMLEVGGMPVLVDEVRRPDDDNPKGYYEFEAVKKTKSDASWLDQSNGKAVKMVYRLLYDLPTDRSYRVLFMRRKIEEVLASQRAMLQRNGNSGDPIPDEKMAQLFKAELDAFYKWAPGQSHIQLIDVDYNQIQQDPQAVLNIVNDFLGGALDVDAMAGVIDKSLYRNRV